MPTTAPEINSIAGCPSKWVSLKLCRRFAPPERLRAKFGWIEGYADQIPMWHACQDVISTFVTFANEQYLHHGASVKLAAAIGELKHPDACELRNRLVKLLT